MWRRFLNSDFFQGEGSSSISQTVVGRWPREREKRGRKKETFSFPLLRFWRSRRRRRRSVGRCKTTGAAAMAIASIGGREWTHSYSQNKPANHAFTCGGNKQVAHKSRAKLKNILSAGENASKHWQVLNFYTEYLQVLPHCANQVSIKDKSTNRKIPPQIIGDSATCFLLVTPSAESCTKVW